MIEWCGSDLSEPACLIDVPSELSTRATALHEMPPTQYIDIFAGYIQSVCNNGLLHRNIVTKQYGSHIGISTWNSWCMLRSSYVRHSQRFGSPFEHHGLSVGLRCKEPAVRTLKALMPYSQRHICCPLSEVFFADGKITLYSATWSLLSASDWSLCASHSAV